MSNLDINNIDSFNPVDFAYLNPEKTSNLDNVEDIYSYYNTEGKYLDLYSNILLPDDFDYRIYLKLNSSNIYTQIGSELYSNYILSDPKRLAIIHNTRYNTSNNFKYKIQDDFKLEVFKAFNDIRTSRLLPNEYYLDYIDRSNNTQLGTEYATLGTISDFMTNILDTAFTSGYNINSDFKVTGITTTNDLIVNNHTISLSADIGSINVSNLNVDNLIVNNTSFTETLFQDGVKLEKDLTVLGSNSIFSNNVQISNLTVINNTYIENLVVNKKAYFNDVVDFNAGFKLVNGNASLSNITNIEYLIVDKTLQVANFASFSNNVCMTSNLKINNSLQVKNAVSLSNNLNVALNVTATEFISLSDNRIKNNIKNISVKKAKDILTNMNVKEYNIQNNKKKHFGLIAQEVEQLTDEIVTTIDSYRLQINKYIIRDIDNIYKISPDIILLENEIIVYSFYENSTVNKYIGIIKNVNNDTFTLERLNYNERIDSIDEKLNFIKHDQIFIHERIINNFKSINYTEIIMLCVTCIQDIYKNMDIIEKSFIV